MLLRNTTPPHHKPGVRDGVGSGPLGGEGRMEGSKWDEGTCHFEANTDFIVIMSDT